MSERTPAGQEPPPQHASTAADPVTSAQSLIETQASLRRLALLVAEGAEPDVVFKAVTKEASRHCGGCTARLIRFEKDGTVTLLANEGVWGTHLRVGHASEVYPPNGLTATIRRTGRAARVDDYSALPDGEPCYQEGLRSALGMPIHVHRRLWGTIAVGSRTENLPGDAEQQMRDFTELIAIAIANAQDRADLIASRARIVTASDEARRRIERDLHDGTQQHLIGIALRLRMAAESAAETTSIYRELDALATDVLGVITDLREISRGIHPAILSDAGLGPAIRALARRSTVPVQTHVRFNRRLPEPIEVCAYYVVSELLANAAKHARASLATVQITIHARKLRICVSDNGIGGADHTRGSGLIGIRDRVEALGGDLRTTSAPGHGTRVCCELPT